MALLLAAAGTFLYVRLGSALDEQIDSALRTRADDVAALVRGRLSARRRGGSRRATRASRRCSGPAARCGTPRGASARSPLLTPDELDRARRETVVVERRRRAPARDAGGRAASWSPAPRSRTETKRSPPCGRSSCSAARSSAARLARGRRLAAATLRPDARTARGRARARAPLRCRCEPRAADAALAAEDRARARAAPASHPKELRAALASAAEETDRLVRLAEDLLVLARSDEGELRLRQEPVEARELLDAVARRFAAARPRGRGRAPARPRRHRRPARLEQALGNLVDNALRYGAGTVRLDGAAGGRRRQLRVADEGAGFPTAFLPRAFERFSRADVARTRRRRPRARDRRGGRPRARRPRGGGEPAGRRRGRDTHGALMRPT